MTRAIGLYHGRRRKVPGGGATLYPLTIPDCVQLIDALSTETVTVEPDTNPPDLRGWADLSVSANHVTATGSLHYLDSNRVSTAVVGLMRCDGVAEDLGSDYTIVYCGNGPAAASWKQLFCLKTSYNVHIRTEYGGQRHLWVGASGELDTGIQIYLGGEEDTKVYVLTVSGTNVETWENGVKYLSTPSLINMGGPGTEFSWCSYTTGVNMLSHAYFYSGIVYARKLTDAEIGSLTTYLLQRYPTP
jgi:hypothetical protein